MSQIARFAEYGDPDVLRVIDAPAPTAGHGQVRIAVRAAGVNPIDWKTVQGLMRDAIPLTLPAGVGSDVSGVVDQVGLGVSEFAVGDEVLGSSVTPSFAEYALAEPANLVRKPDGIAWEVAGSLAGSGGTAYAVLKRLRLKAGETLLIHAAAGGVGTFAVQLAVARDGHRNRRRAQSGLPARGARADRGRTCIPDHGTTSLKAHAPGRISHWPSGRTPPHGPNFIRLGQPDSIDTVSPIALQPSAGMYPAYRTRKHIICGEHQDDLDVRPCATARCAAAIDRVTSHVVEYVEGMAADD